MKRIWHPWTNWECYPAGFYKTIPPDGMSSDDARLAYSVFLADLPRFQRGIEKVFSTWVHSCEHFLSNESMNRIAWIGQSSMCIATGVPSHFRGGFNLLSESEKMKANVMARDHLQKWLAEHEAG